MDTLSRPEAPLGSDAMEVTAAERVAFTSTFLQKSRAHCIMGGDVLRWGTRPLAREKKNTLPPGRAVISWNHLSNKDTISRPKKLIFMALLVILFLNKAHDIDVGLLFNHNSY